MMIVIITITERKSCGKLSSIPRGSYGKCLNYEKSC